MTPDCAAGGDPLHPGLRAVGAQGRRGTCGLAGVLLPWHDRCHGSPVWCSFMLLVLGKTAIRRRASWLAIKASVDLNPR